jgi:hypothetical protein
MSWRPLIEELYEVAGIPKKGMVGKPLNRRVTRRKRQPSAAVQGKKPSMGRPGTSGRKRFAGIGRRKRETPDQYRERTGQCPPGYRYDGVHCVVGKKGAGEVAISPREKQREQEEKEERRKQRRAALKRAATKARVDKARKGPDSAAVEAAPANVRRIMARIPRNSWWRPDNDEVNLKDVGPDEFAAQHTGISKKGSAIIGTPHMGSDATPEEKAYFRERVIPTAIVQATRAIDQGKPVTFLAEDRAWWSKEPGALDQHYPGESEQYQVAAALNDRFGSKVKHDSWDDDEVAIDQPGAKVWGPLAELAGSKTKAHTAISAMLLGQGDTVESLRDRGILTPEAEDSLKQQGFDLAHFGESMQRALYTKTFPQDFGTPPTEMSAVAAGYNALRQQNLIRKMRKIEEAGGVAIVTPGASHAWNLKFAVEANL